MKKTCLKGTSHCEYNSFYLLLVPKLKSVCTMLQLVICLVIGNHLECLLSTRWLLILSDELPNLIQNCLNEPEFICNKTFSARNNHVALWACNDMSFSKLEQKTDDTLHELLICSRCEMVHCLWDDINVYLSSAQLTLWVEWFYLEKVNPLGSTSMVALCLLSRI